MVAVDRAEKRIVGYIMVWKIHDDVQINNIAVHPDFRRSGIGEAMLRDVLDGARAAGAAFVSLRCASPTQGPGRSMKRWASGCSPSARNITPSPSKTRSSWGSS